MINEVLTSSNTSSLEVGIDFTERLQRFDKSVAWPRYARLALTMTPMGYLKDIRSYL